MFVVEMGCSIIAEQSRRIQIDPDRSLLRGVVRWMERLAEREREPIHSSLLGQSAELLDNNL